MSLSSILAFIFIGATVVQVLFWVLVFARMGAYPKLPIWLRQLEKPSITTHTSLPPISVIICGCNEADNLNKYLDRFLTQDYPFFEVVVVDDNSSDETEKILFAFQKKYSILHPVTIKEQHPPGKKYALQVGIAAAKYDLLLLSDADCYPASPHWMRHMQSLIKDEVLIGLGYSPYEYRNGLLNRFIRFEAIYTAIQYFSFSIVGMPYMGVGRNLIYHKSLYQQQQGFSAHLDLASGDDDLFVNAVANRKNTAVQLAPDSFVFTIPKMTWGGYYHQKKRHLTTGTRYKPLHQLVLGALSASHFFHYMGGLAWGLYSGQWTLILVFYLARATVVATVIRPILRRLKALSLWPWVLFLDILYLCYYVVFAPVLIIGNPRTSWKH